MNGRSIKPSKWYYGLAALITIVGIVIFIIFLFNAISSMTEGMTQVVVPGQKTVELHEPGTYMIYYEYMSVIGNKIYSTDQNLSGLECVVIEQATGQHITLSAPATASTYSMGNRSGRAIFAFTIDRAGHYFVQAAYPEGNTGPEVVIAVGKDITFKIVSTVLVAIAIVFVSLILAVVIVIITFVKRRKASRQQV